MASLSVKKLFGTDGIRGIAGHEPLTSKTVLALGHAAGELLRAKYKTSPLRVLLVRDTRQSGAHLLSCLAQGLREQGIDVYDGGVLNTPSVAYLVQAHRFQSGVVISASHNPPEFNGIKFFTSYGAKWPDTWERAVEKKLASSKKIVASAKPGHILKANTLGEDYEDFLISTLERRTRLDGIKIVLDCSNGANYQVAPCVLKRLGATLKIIGNKPNGKNINVGCGSQNVAKLSKEVRRSRAHAGVAFDGDGDRVIFVDEKGAEVDGDQIIALLAECLLREKKLSGRTVVSTVMANVGFRLAMKKLGIRLIETAVGDRHVSEAMKKTGSVLGGEQSGHIILGRFLPSGDGLLTALHVLHQLKKDTRPLSEQLKWIKKYPQVLVNVRVAEKRPIQDLNGVQKTIHDVERHLKDKGRVLIRYSGTEPLLRIMLEGPDKDQLNDFATTIADEVKRSQK